MALAVAPGGRMGFIFTVFQVMPSYLGVPVSPNVIISPYRPPSVFISTVFEKFRNRNVKVLGARKDAETMQASLGQMGRRCEAEDLMMSWMSPEGAS